MQEIGKRIRDRRTELGLTQKNVGDLIGVTFQQIQKYESGENELTVSRLYDMARALEWDVFSILTNESNSKKQTRKILEIIKRIKLLDERELIAISALLNHLCRGRML